MKSKTKDKKTPKIKSKLRIKPPTLDTEKTSDIKIYDNLNPIFTERLREQESIVSRLLETKKKFMSSNQNSKAIKKLLELKFDNDSDLVVISGKVIINGEELIYEKLKDPVYSEKQKVECAFCGLSSRDTKYFESLGAIYGPYISKKEDEDDIYAHDQCILWFLYYINNLPLFYIFYRTDKLYFNVNNSVKHAIFKSVAEAEQNICKICHKPGASLHCATSHGNCKSWFHLPCLIYKQNNCKLKPYQFEVRCENHKQDSSQSYIGSNESSIEENQTQKEFDLLIECKHKNDKYEFNKTLKFEKKKNYCVLCGYRIFKKNQEFSVECQKCNRFFHEECIQNKLKVKKFDKASYKCFDCLMKAGGKKAVKKFVKS